MAGYRLERRMREMRGRKARTRRASGVIIVRIETRVIQNSGKQLSSWESHHPHRLFSKVQFRSWLADGRNKGWEEGEDEDSSSRKGAQQEKILMSLANLRFQKQPSFRSFHHDCSIPRKATWRTILIFALPIENPCRASLSFPPSRVVPDDIIVWYFLSSDFTRDHEATSSGSRAQLSAMNLMLQTWCKAGGLRRELLVTESLITVPDEFFSRNSSKIVWANKDRTSATNLLVIKRGEEH